MLERFLIHFPVDDRGIAVGDESASIAEEVRRLFGRHSVCNGLYRFHSNEGAITWRSIVSEYFELPTGLELISYDWRGNQIGYDPDRNVMVMYDISLAEFFEIEAGVSEFHDEIMVDDPEVVAFKAFEDWLSDKPPPSIDMCIGFKIPLALGGKDEIENMELVDMRVYWGICGEIDKAITKPERVD